MRVNLQKEAWPTRKQTQKMQRLAPAATSPSRAAEDEGENEEDEFLRESRDVGVEFVRLMLGEGGPGKHGEGRGAVPLGPGDEPSPKSPSERRQSEDGASGGRQHSRV